MRVGRRLLVITFLILVGAIFAVMIVASDVEGQDVVVDCGDGYVYEQLEVEDGTLDIILEYSEEWLYGDTLVGVWTVWYPDTIIIPAETYKVVVIEGTGITIVFRGE